MTAALIATVLFAAVALARAIWVRLGRCDDVHQRTCLANLGRIELRPLERPAHHWRVATRRHRQRAAGPAHRRRTGASCTVDRARSTAA